MALFIAIYIELYILVQQLSEEKKTVSQSSEISENY